MAQIESDETAEQGRTHAGTNQGLGLEYITGAGGLTNIKEYDRPEAPTVR